MEPTTFSTAKLLDDHQYVAAKKEVFNVQDMDVWEKSEAYHEYFGFIIMLNEEVKGKKMTTECRVTKGLLDLIDIIDKWVDEIPPMEQPQRFGNKSFRTWFQKLQENAPNLLKTALPTEFHQAIPEVSVYLIESVGNSTRIDYGTGHEMAFVMFLCCLYKINAFSIEDSLAVVFKIFNRYLIFMRKLQLTYRMEPAGSHGVWSLDDYQFLPFIWGSSQLIGHPRLLPKNFYNPDNADAYAKDYMFLACIQFIHKVKSGPFAEHSNQLWNISAVPSWEKINSGLVKMYKAEVLSKFPVIQHVMFGSLLPIRPSCAASACDET
uniref:Serine/threonine-protein phosphatase 2A activator n=1 Tax=Strigamia maritima TaxID=126957 RepID=T1IJQ0_STRMM